MAVGLCGSATRVRAADARLTWQPVANAAGYRLYVRQGTSAYGAGTELGLPPAGTDGFMRYTSQGLPAGATSYFALTAYDSSGRESALSNELALQIAAPPTATPTNSFTVPPTATRTFTPPPTATRTFTPPPMATHTFTPPPTQTPTFSPTPVTSASPQPTPTSSKGRHNVSGHIHYYGDSSAMGAVNVQLTGTQGSSAVTTDSTGTFEFAAVLDGTWELQPEKQGDFMAGVSALDAARVLQAVSGVRTLGPIETVACDVTGNGTLSGVDAARILQLAVGAIDHLPVTEACASDFVFMPEPIASAVTQIVPPRFADNVCQPGGIMVNPLSTDMIFQDFAAAAFGDCTGNWSPDADAAQAVTSAAVTSDQAPAPSAASRLQRTHARTDAQLGRPRQMSDGGWRVPVYVRSTATVDALEVHVDFDPALAVFDSLRLVGTARRALSRQHADTSGQLKVAIASGRPMRMTRLPLAYLTFRAADAPRLQLLRVLVNDGDAEVAESD